MADFSLVAPVGHRFEAFSLPLNTLFVICDQCAPLFGQGTACEPAGSYKGHGIWAHSYVMFSHYFSGRARKLEANRIPS